MPIVGRHVRVAAVLLIAALVAGCQAAQSSGDSDADMPTPRPEVDTPEGRNAAAAWELAREDPSDPAALVRLGWALYALEDYDSAMTYATEALRLDPEHAQAELLASSVAFENGDMAQAEQFSQQAVLTARQKGDEETLAAAVGMMGIVLGEQGRYEEAIPHLEEAVELAPLDFDYRYRLAVAYNENGDTDRARAALEWVLSLNQEDKRARELLDELQ